MWTCPKCQEQLEDQFDSCWKCAGESRRKGPRDKSERPLRQFESIFLMIAFLPGIIFFANGHARTPEQATFRIVTIVLGFLFGLGGYIAIKIYQKRHEGE